jgi:hypothetical protein
MFLPHVDPDARAPGDRTQLQPAILDVQSRAEQIGAILRPRDPHGFRQVPRTLAKVVNLSRRAAPAPHHLDSLERIERANQDGGRRAVGFGDDVHHPVDAVVQIDVRMSCGAVHGGVPGRGPGRRVARWIGLADVCLHFDDGAARADAAPIVNEYFAKQIASNVEGGAIVEGSRQLHETGFAADALSRAAARSAAFAT